ncbi:MAG: tetratricopeptide repeat protein [Holosporaceae bacterium]|jgi:TolA-binding protein|nr:tetratricopeptide repeat protein [Holosporaceae bacterium]
MKKVVSFLSFIVFISGVNASDSDFSELSESTRENTGKIEELSKTVAEMQKKISLLEEALIKKNQEESDQKTTEIISKKTPDEVVKMARDLIEENNMDEARKMLSAFVTKNPTNVYNGMMLFYMGNSYFVEKDYKNAALEYMKGFQANPSGSKSAETLYKLAICFKQLQQMDKYKSTLKKIIDDYPGEFAKKASAELKKTK